jgi:hypothetical protein
VYAPGKALFVCDALKQGGQVSLFIVRKRRQQNSLMVAGNLTNSLQHCLSRFRQVKGIPAAVQIILSPLDQATRLKLI